LLIHRVILPVLLTGLMLVVSSCKSCSSTGSSPCPTGQKGAGLILLNKVPSQGEGPLLYSGDFGTLPSSCTNRLDSFSNQSTFPIRIVEKGSSPSNCLSSSVRLNLNQFSTQADMMKVFGDLHPKLPVTVVACVEAGGNPPDTLSVGLQYTTTP